MSQVVARLPPLRRRYGVPVPQEEWAKQLADVIAAEVDRWRKARRMSVQQLADAMTELGCPIKRPVLSNLLNGRRPTVSVTELLALGAVLQVPPMLLLFPLGRRDTMEVLPGLEMSPLDAAARFVGDDEDPGLYAQMRTVHGLVGRYRQFQDRAAEYRRRAQELRAEASLGVPPGTDDEDPDVLDDWAAATESAMKRTGIDMIVAYGGLPDDDSFTRPKLPDDHAWMEPDR